MKILICIKQVPDLESGFKPDSTGGWYDETDLAWRMNEYDEFAVEEAIRLREQLGEQAELTVLSIGPDRVLETIKKALAMGCDNAVHVRDVAASTKDPWQIATLIASYAKDKGFSLIFTGIQSQDRGSAQVGVFVAEQLGHACTTTVIGFNYDNGTITATRELEGGVKAVIKMQLPALVTCQSGLNVPRYPTLPNIMKAKKKEIKTISAADLSAESPMTTTVSFHPPVKKSCGIVLDGEVGSVADQLIAILKEKTSLLR